MVTDTSTVFELILYFLVLLFQKHCKSKNFLHSATIKMIFFTAAIFLAFLVDAEAVEKRKNAFILRGERKNALPLRRELRPSKGSSKSKGCPEPPTCPNFEFSGSGKSGKPSGKKGSCGDEETVRCFGDPYVNTKVTLADDLFCSGAGTGSNASPFITMEGPNAILDCDDYSIMSLTQGEGIGVLLVDGASVVNCNIFNVEHAVESTGFGCSTIMSIVTSFTDGDAILIGNNGSAIAKNIVVSETDTDAININVDGSGTVDVVLSDITVDSAYDHGLHFDNAPDGGATVGLYGDITMRSVEDGTISANRVSGAIFDITAYCNMVLLGGEDDGILLASNTSITFAATSTTTSCFNMGDDLQGDSSFPNGFTKEVGAFVQCDSIKDADIVCDSPCVVPPGENTPGQVEASVCSV